PAMQSFVEAPHTAICGQNQGPIINMVATEAQPAREAILSMTTESPSRMIAEVQKLVMPNSHSLKAKDVDLKRLGAMLWLTHEKQPADFEDLLLLQGMGPRTLQSMALVSEVIYGTPSRFSDPARFAFAHGGKDGHPFPVPVKVYDETLSVLSKAIAKAKIGQGDKLQAIQKLGDLSRQAEKDFTPNDNFDELIEKERKDSWKYGGKTIFGDAKPPKNGQLDLF
ncbi:MAG TPA: DUF763 domain-containing protein, partial [Pedobacter sp.]